MSYNFNKMFETLEGCIQSSKLDPVAGSGNSVMEGIKERVESEREKGIDLAEPLRTFLDSQEMKEWGTLFGWGGNLSSRTDIQDPVR